MAYIHYDQKANGVTYASVYESYREGGKVKTRRIETLGRVVDKEKGIFRRNGTTFQYTVDNGRSSVSEPLNPEPEKLILDFGDAWFLKEYLSRQPFYPAIANILPDEKDTVLALIFYQLLMDRKPNDHGEKIWFEGSYACLAFPQADLASQNINRVLEKLGNEEVHHSFFREYMSCVYGNKGTAGIFIDSVGIPDATKTNITQVSNRNGQISHEIRLIYVMDQRDGKPIYFRYAGGNIMDASTLIAAVSELRQDGISTSYAIADTEYFSEKNVLELFNKGIPFVTQLPRNRTLFKDVASDNLDGLMSQKYACRYGERLAFIKKVPVQVCKRAAFVYLCIDEDMYLMQHKEAMLNAMDSYEKPDEADADIKMLGVFAILTSEDIPENELLPLYYTQQQVEQVFGICKNYPELLPIQVQTEQAFAGHLLIRFIAAAIMMNLQQELRKQKENDLTTESIFCKLRNQKCKVYGDYLIPQEPQKKVSAIYDIFKLKVPCRIPHRSTFQE